MHREQEAASAYRYEVEEGDLPSGLPPSSHLWGHSGVRADAARAMMLCLSQTLSPLSLEGQWNGSVGGRGQPEVDGWGEGVADSKGPAGTVFWPEQGVVLLLTSWHLCLPVSFF